MSADLIWQLVKDNNSFLVKRGRTSRLGAVQFSKEPGNLMNVNSFKYSGIATSRPVILASGSEDVTLTTKVVPLLSSLNNHSHELRMRRCGTSLPRPARRPC